MSLDPIKPDQAFKPGTTLNPNGRPKGSTNRKTSMKVMDRLLGKWRTHPVDRLVELANYLQDTGKIEEAAEIWTNLLRYCEPAKKPIETAPEKRNTPSDSKAAADETFKLLEELENGRSETKGSEGSSVEERKITLHPSPSPETNLQEYPGE